MLQKCIQAEGGDRYAHWKTRRAVFNRQIHLLSHAINGSGGDRLDRMACMDRLQLWDRLYREPDKSATQYNMMCTAA